ncbi:hypothetical protein J2T10_002716 [Paenarthrobacter nicotinovorans]|uniref:Uncharacterized protein n=1 Tax=Paenarthrobacter nicotinovorans TaxID=29320 RepID=A0ABT9TN13_PAENI|nr:hypothetical protein [Paenarthrobacter nicotinovorans]MDQ0103059.1 hypothetical protein [Paenarthrobacter nicotinovorans]GAT88386.1 hypothetical protein CVCC1112_3045 [Paenarthrobacter nicotinovorans]
MSRPSGTGGPGDLLAATRPAPIGVHDIINSVIPQWHRRTA